MTNAVKELETEFGVALMERDRNGLILTAAGEELLELSIRLLNDADLIKMVMRDKVDETRRLLMGSPNMTSVSAFPELFRILHNAYPDIEIQLTQDITANLLPLLDEGKLNVLLIPYRPEDSKYCSLIWKKSRFLFCVSKDHPLASRTCLSFQEIKDEPLISYFGDIYLKNFSLIEKYRENNGDMKIIYRCGQIKIMQELISKNEGCGFLVESSFSENNNIVGIPLEEALPVTVYLVWKKESARLSVVRKLLSCVTEHLEANSEW